MDTEIIILYVAILFHTLLWSAVLKVLDHIFINGNFNYLIIFLHDIPNIDQ